MGLDSQSMDDFKNYVKIAREHAYFGKYAEAINMIKQAVENVNSIKQSCSEEILIETWNRFEIDLRSELEVITELNSINQGFIPTPTQFHFNSIPSQTTKTSPTVKIATHQIQIKPTTIHLEPQPFGRKAFKVSENNPNQKQNNNNSNMNSNNPSSDQNPKRQEGNKKFPYGIAPFSHLVNNNLQPEQQQNQEENNQKGVSENEENKQIRVISSMPNRDSNSSLAPVSEPTRSKLSAPTWNSSIPVRTSSLNNHFTIHKETPIEQNTQNSSNFNVEFYTKPKDSSPTPPQQLNDPDVWQEPPVKRLSAAQQRKDQKSSNRYSSQAKSGYNPKDIKNNNNNSNNSTTNLNVKSRSYVKPWMQNAQDPTKKKRGNENKSSSEEGGGNNQKSFLHHMYPDGHGPDSELISCLEREVVEQNPNVSFDSIAELESAKNMLQEAVLLPLLIPKYFRGIRRPLIGALLFGPPGTGKTLLAKAIATTGKMTFFNISASSLASKWKGDSEKLVRILFEMARFYSPSTIFFDEIDAIGSKRGDGEGEANRKVKAELLIQMDGVSNSATQSDETDRKQVMVLAATNRPWDLDEALRRRLEKRILIPLPSEKGRSQLFKLNMKGISIDERVDWEVLVKKSEGYSGADITSVCRDASFMPMRRKLEKEGGIKNIENIQNLELVSDVPITQEDFEQALKNINTSVGKKDLEKFEKWMSEFGSL